VAFEIQTFITRPRHSMVALRNAWFSNATGI